SETHGVRVSRRVDLPDGLWHRYSAEDRRLDLSAHLTAGQQAFRVASELAFLEHGDLLEPLVDGGAFRSPAGRDLALRGLASSFAAAGVTPYQRSHNCAASCADAGARRMSCHVLRSEPVCRPPSPRQRAGAPAVPQSTPPGARAGNSWKRQWAS